MVNKRNAVLVAKCYRLTKLNLNDIITYICIAIVLKAQILLPIGVHQAFAFTSRVKRQLKCNRQMRDYNYMFKETMALIFLQHISAHHYSILGCTFILYWQQAITGFSIKAYQALLYN